jgi:hypothetical protein
MRHESGRFEMNRFCFNAVAITLIALGHLATPLIAKEGNQALRSIAEQQTKDAFDQAVSKFRKAAQEKDSHVFDKEPNDMERVIDAIKSLYYNDAYSLYICMKVAAAETAPSGDESIQTKRNCYEKRNSAQRNTVKILMQYTSLFTRNKEKAKQCELKSRLFDAEIEFPPFDFLKQSDGRDNLYDYSLMNQCLLSITQ